MHRAKAFVLIAGALSILTAGVIACSEEEGSEFKETQEDAGPDGEVPGFVLDDGATPPPLPVDCNPNLPTQFEAEWIPPTVVAGACDSAELGEFYDLCFAGSDAGSCAAWRADHATCAGCLAPEDLSGPIEQHLDGKYQTLNVAGCLSIKRGETGEEQCPSKYQAAVQCRRASCERCFNNENASFNDFLACQEEARDTGCKSFDDAQKTSCGDLNVAGANTYDCFRHSEEPRAHTLRVMGLFCL